MGLQTRASNHACLVINFRVKMVKKSVYITFLLQPLSGKLHFFLHMILAVIKNIYLKNWHMYICCILKLQINSLHWIGSTDVLACTMYINRMKRNVKHLWLVPRDLRASHTADHAQITHKARTDWVCASRNWPNFWGVGDRNHWRITHEPHTYHLQSLTYCACRRIQAKTV